MPSAPAGSGRRRCRCLAGRSSGLLPGGLARRADPRLAQGSAHGLGERVDVICTVMAAAVDEERRRARDAARVRARNVFGHARCVLVASQLLPEALDVETQLLSEAPELLRGQFLLVGEKRVIHLPEGALA